MLRDNMRTLSLLPAFRKVCEATARPAPILKKRPSVMETTTSWRIFNHLYVEEIYIILNTDRVMPYTYLIPHQFLPWHKLCLIVERLLVNLEFGLCRLSGRERSKAALFCCEPSDKCRLTHGAYQNH
jgi:hypothetical protein